MAHPRWAQAAPARLHAQPLVNGTLGLMTGVKAGVRRNRLPRGTTAVHDNVYFAPRTAEAIAQAARDSGNLSLSLYLERLALLLETERGALPLITDELTEALKKPD